MINAVGWLITRTLYLVACIACLVFLTPVLAMVGAGVGVLGGGLLVLVLTGGVLVAGLVPGGRQWAAPVLTPWQVSGGALPGRVPRGFVRRDRAWPQYFAAQLRLDLGAIASRTRDALDDVWAEPLDWMREHHPGWYWPLYLPVVVAQVAATAGAAVLLLVTAAVLSGVALPAWVAGLAVGYALRGVDRAWRLVFRAGASCPRCYELCAVPAYRCKGPHTTDDRVAGHDLHRDLRPGRLGVLWRRCGCGLRLPTTVLRASASRRLEARCPSCTEPLHRGAGVLTDVRVPVFGAASAGKTQLIMGALVTLHRMAADRGITVTLPDEHSRRTYTQYAELVEAGRPAAKTDAGRPPVAVTVQLVRGLRSALVHVFDAAGEALVDTGQNTRLSYLDYARALVFVLDPFSIRRLRDQYQVSYAAVFEEANAALHDPEGGYNTTAQRLRDYGVRMRRQRLAFVVSKADLLEKLCIGPDGTGSDQVRDWLCAQGLDNLVAGALRDFGTVRFFLVSANNLDRDGALAPLNWILTEERVGLA